MKSNEIRSNIYPGLDVDIVLKKDQRTGKLTAGIVQDILTSSAQHHRGIKVRLMDGQVGRVQHIYEGENSSEAPLVQESAEDDAKDIHHPDDTDDFFYW